MGWRGDAPIKLAVRRIISDPSLTFVASSLLRLETVPKAIYRRNDSEVEFLESFFDLVAEWVPVDDGAIQDAIRLGGRYDVVNIDALHAVAAIRGRVDRLVTSEKPGKPLYRVREIATTHFLDV